MDITNPAPGHPANFDYKKYPCKVVQEWDGGKIAASPTDLPGIGLKMGAEGQVMNVIGSGDKTFIRIGFKRLHDRHDNFKDTAFGWAPARCILVGTVRKVGDYLREYYDSPLPNIIPFMSPAPGVPPPGRVLEFAVSQYWESIYNGRDSYKEIPPWFFDYLHCNTFDALAVFLLNAIRSVSPTLATILNSGAPFTVNAILTHSIEVFRSQPNPNTNGRPGIYCFYYTFPNEPSRAPELYVGISIDPPSRLKGHYRDENEPWYHYRQTKGSIRRMFFIADVPDANYGVFAESSLITFLETHAPDVKAYQLRNVGTNPKAENPMKLGGRQMYNAYLVIKRTYSLPGACDNPAFGAIAGLNTQTPCLASSSKEKPQWTRQRFGGVTQYRSKPYNVREVDGSRSMRIFEKPNRRSFGFGRLLSSPGPKPGTMVSYVFETMENGQRHPYPWALSPLMAWKDSNRVNQLGMRIEWTEGGNERALYLQNIRNWS